MGPIGYHETSEWNYYLMMNTIPEKYKSQNMFNFGVSFHQDHTKWSNINVFCDIISENIV